MAGYPYVFARAPREIIAAGLAIALTSAPATSAGELGLDACSDVAGTYMTTITDIEGVFSSRGLLSFGADGLFLMSDSSQAGLPGVYDPFGSAQGSWSCLESDGQKQSISAVGLNFVLPGDGRGAAFGRVDYKASLDAKTGILAGSAALSFTSDGDLEGADPMERPGPAFERFNFEGKPVVSKSE